MATYSREFLSGSTRGAPIKISGTAPAAAGTVHITSAGTANLDEVWIWAVNHDSVARMVTLCWGGTVDPDNQLEATIQPSSTDLPQPVSPGWPLQGNGSAGGTVLAYAAAANVILLVGHVNRKTG